MQTTLLNVVRRWYAQSPALVGTGVFMLFFALLCCVGMVLDDREVLGLNVWIKPQKFALSIAVFVFTMAWIIRVHRVPPRMVSIIVWVLVVSIILEQGLITMQAARGVRSHFNFTTKFNIIVYSLMGVFVAAATLASIAAMLMPLRGEMDALPLHFRCRRWTRAGLRVGEACFVLGCIFAAWLASGKGHMVSLTSAAPVADGGAGLPYVNWSTQHPQGQLDGRALHFLMSHLLQIAPLIGAFIDSRLKNSAR